MLRSILYLSVATYLAVFGVLVTIWPEKVRAFYVRQYTRGLGSLKKLGDPTSWERLFPRASVFRLFGITSLLTFVVVVYAWLRG
jgi:hypothetical protein